MHIDGNNNLYRSINICGLSQICPIAALFLRLNLERGFLIIGASKMVSFSIAVTCFSSLLSDICYSTPIGKPRSMANIAWGTARYITTFSLSLFQWDRNDGLFIVGCLEPTVGPIFALLRGVCTSFKESFAVRRLVRSSFLLSSLSLFHTNLRRKSNSALI